MELVPCFEDEELCVIAGTCTLRTALCKALVAFLAVLDQYTLADLVEPRRRLATRLRVEPLRSERVTSAAGVAS
jgi:Rrf2 family nitric oxide-sensitive transcriptional repressor